MYLWWIILVIIIIISTIIGIGLYKLIRYFERKDRERYCKDLHEKNNSKSYVDDIDGKQKQDDVPYIDIPENLDIDLSDRISLEGEANIVRSGIRNLRFFKTAIPRIRKSGTHNEIITISKQEEYIRTLIMKGLEKLNEKNIDVEKIEEYIDSMGKPNDWK